MDPAVEHERLALKLGDHARASNLTARTERDDLEEFTRFVLHRRRRRGVDDDGGHDDEAGNEDETRRWTTGTRWRYRMSEHRVRTRVFSSSFYVRGAFTRARSGRRREGETRVDVVETEFGVEKGALDVFHRDS